MTPATSSVELSFLWHMHQPDYRDANGVIRMPWVFLHAIKDYYDMPWMLSKFPSLKASFNLTPPLIEQIKLYENPLENDYFLKLWYQDSELLSGDDKEWLIKTCKSANYDMMIKPNPYFLELYHKEKLTQEEIIDLEILFMLAWCGPYLRLHCSVIQILLTKKRDYTAEDKEKLFKVLIDFVATILPFYASLLESGQIALSTTPYNHPILPLLIDMDNVQRANPHSTAPENSLSLYDDAVEQVRRAVELYKETFGQDPIGFWPAEGAVDEASVAIYKKFDIKWIATDEAILFRSIDSEDRSKLYQAYQRDGLKIYFRDHGLSDLFGFDYRFKPPSDAVAHFINSIKALEVEDDDEKHKNTVFVILDGENAWEYYQSNGYSFFMQLYEELVEYKWCETVTMDEIAKRDDAVALEKLASGSWIYGDFTTWSGHPEKNRAWELIFETKRAYLNYQKTISDKVKKEIEFNFLAAECSDWFWWYGDDHNTNFALEFDKLFRGHLITIYNLLDLSIPPRVLEPIIQDDDFVPFLQPAQNLISPKIDGEKKDFFSWIGSGVVNESRIFSTMDRVRGPIELIKFGFNSDKIFIAFEGDIEMVIDSYITIRSEALTESIRVSLSRNNMSTIISIVIDKNIEIALCRTLFDTSQAISLNFEIEEQGKILQTLPGYGALDIDLEEDYSDNWFV